MPSRSFHTKSRHGCINCRQKRKRCDLGQPTCGPCARRGDVCTYSYGDRSHERITSSLPPISPLTSQTKVAPRNTLDAIRDIASLNLPQVGSLDLELISHFLVSDSGELDTIPGISSIRRLDIAQKAAEYPFLLYGLLAVSALHLHSSTVDSNISGRQFFVERARTHQQMALSSYISSLKTLDSDTCPSICRFSIILAGLGYGFLSSSQEPASLNAKSYLNEVISIFELFLGAVAVANEARSWTQKSWLEPLNIPIRPDLHQQKTPVQPSAQKFSEDLCEGIHEALAAENTMIPRSTPEDVSILYTSAIPELLNVFQCLGKPAPDNFRGVIGWPAFVSGSFLSLLKQGHPAALVVLAHYGVTLHALNYAWWLRGVGSRLVRSVAEILTRDRGKEWQKLLRWPTMQLEKPTLVQDYSAVTLP